MPTTAIAGLDKAKAPQLRRASRILASTAIALMAWTFPRVGVFKLSEAFALISSPGLFFSVKSIVPILKCYWIFILATAISLVISVFMMGKGSITLTSDKGLYSNPEAVPFITLLHIGIYFLTILVFTHFFSSASEEDVSKTLRWSYYVTLLPGILQILRIYSGSYFNLP